VHHLRNIFNRHHLPFEHRKNLRQRHRAHLHVPQRKTARARFRRVKSSINSFSRNSEALDYPPLLTLERFAFEYLRNPPPQKINARLHILLERVRLPARQRKAISAGP